MAAAAGLTPGRAPDQSITPGGVLPRPGVHADAFPLAMRRPDPETAPIVPNTGRRQGMLMTFMLNAKPPGGGIFSCCRLLLKQIEDSLARWLCQGWPRGKVAPQFVHRPVELINLDQCLQFLVPGRQEG